MEHEKENDRKIFEGSKSEPEWFKPIRFYRPKEFRRSRPKKRPKRVKKGILLQTLVEKLKSRASLKKPTKKRNLDNKNASNSDVEISSNPSQKFVFLFRNVRKGKISISKNVPVIVAGRPKNVSASISVVNSNLNETSKKLCGLRSVQLKLKTFTDADRTGSISAASSSKRKPDQIESSKKIKPSKKIDDDSGIVSGENNFFTKNHEPRTIADRKELNFDSLHELSVWHRVAQKNGDENFENSQTMDPVREWNETVDEWRNFGPNCSKSVQNKVQSNTDATESKTLPKYSKPKSSTVYVYAKPKSCVNRDKPHSFDVRSNQAEEPTEGENIFVNYEFSVDSNILRFMDEIDKKWLPPKKKPKQKLNRLRMDDEKDDEDSIRVVNIF